MSLLSKLFGGSKPASKAAEAVAYEGFSIIPEPMEDGSRFRLAAKITKDIAGETRQHHLVRADVLNSWDEAADAALAKAKQVIDEQGDRLFG
jgi:hypothetical protein